MKNLVVAALTVVIIAGVAAVASAVEEQTLTGNVMCAKCTLKKADAKACQDVLVVKDQTATREYYVTKNEVATKFGHTCTGEKAVVVTVTVTEKEGKAWITPTKMEEKLAEPPKGTK
jgi:hypothetical protein